MKLAEALEKRKALKEKVDDLLRRLRTAATYQEGNEPLESPNEVLRDLIGTNRELASLIQAINKKNQEHVLENGLTIADAVVLRDQLMWLQEHLQDVINDVRREVANSSRYSRSELRTILALDIKAAQDVIDEIAEEARKLNVLIQQANWSVDLDVVQG